MFFGGSSKIPGVTQQNLGGALAPPVPRGPHTLMHPFEANPTCYNKQILYPKEVGNACLCSDQVKIFETQFMENDILT